MTDHVDPPRSAVCPQCGKTITLKKDGAFRSHRSGDKPWPGAPFTNVCTESGVTPPATDPTPTPLDLATLKGNAKAALRISQKMDYRGNRNPSVSVKAGDMLALIARVTAAESSLARYIVQRTRFGDAMAAAAVPAVVDAIMRELTADSDKRAREATARFEAAEAKISAVRELHPESIAYPLLPDGTPDLNAAPMGRVCLTCSDESIEGNLDDGEWTVEDGGNVFYPCPTIAALDGTA